MYHKGLSRELVIDTAVALAEENGLDKFSLHVLATRLNVKTASLYKHISGLDDVITQIGLRALRMQQEAHLAAIEGKQGDEAVMALGLAYRAFATEHSELYRTIISSQTINETLRTEAEMVTGPIMSVFDAYHLDGFQKMHWQRIFRSVVHGFIAHEEAGYFIHYAADKEETFRLALQCFIDGLKKAATICESSQ